MIGFAYYIVWGSWRPSPPCAVALVLLALLVALGGPSRVYLGATWPSWPSAVLGVYLLIGVWLAGTIDLHRALPARLGMRWANQERRRSSTPRWTEMVARR